MKRHLAAILYADVAGYSRLTERDLESTHVKLDTALDLLTDKINEHEGRKVHEAGDAILAEFSSVANAVDCAVEFQLEMKQRNAGVGDDDRLAFRIGVNLGEVIHDRGDVYGDGVNLTARIQELAPTGGVCITGAVRQQIHGTSELEFDDLGYRKLKNIAQSVRVYALKDREAAGTAKRGIFFDRMDKPQPTATGGCLCGEIRFEITGRDIGSSYCHCRMCQRFAGAPVSAGTGFHGDDFRITKGEPKLYQSSVIAERAFCPTCGSALWMKFFAWEWIFVKTASLDNPEDFAPTTHFGIESQLPWHDVHDELPRLRSEESAELDELWKSAGVDVDDPPRNTTVSRKPAGTGK